MKQLTKWLWMSVLFAAACGDAPEGRDSGAVAAPDTTDPVETSPPGPPPPVLHAPVDVYEAGRKVRTVDASEAGIDVIDLGDDWTPILFTESDGEGQPTFAHPYRATFLALARGEFPDDHHGARAREDKYLELYGIPPTVTVLRTRLANARSLACWASVDLGPIAAFRATAAFDDSARSIAQARRFTQGRQLVARLRTEQGLADGAAPDVAALSRADQDLAREWTRGEARFLAIEAVQRRLECEGYFVGKRRFVAGALDAPTHDAIAEFERRHRQLGWGNLSRDTLAMLAKPTAELEREAVVRVLTERAMHDLGIVEDGSVATLEDGRPNTYASASGGDRPVPNLERALRERIVSSFGLATPESTAAFLDSLETLGARRLVAIPEIERPEYHSPDMDLSIEIDRGDVWYDFPYDAQGREQPQGVERRPSMTVYATYRGRRFALARFGTTIGGWRSEFVDDVVMWAYKESPPGPVVWEKIVSAPVWLPPETATPRSLLVRGRNGWAPNQHETGPSYASAYGLVAAYHRPFVRRGDGSLELRGDQGIRSHGSVDYMSIARRHSHGCHRLHNHLAVRLMSFVLRHRRYERHGEDDVGYSRAIVYEGKTYTLRVDQGGYEFRLVRPIPVEVLPGRIRGERTLPIETELPRFDPTVGAYVLPDGGAATVDRLGNVTPIPWPVDASAPGDGGVPHDAGVRRDAGHADRLDAGVH